RLERAILQFDLGCDLRSESGLVEEIADTQAAPSDLIFVCRTDAARRSSDLSFAELLLDRGFKHAMVGKDQVTAIGNEQPPVDVDAGSFERLRLFEKRKRIQNNAAADDARHARVKDAGGDNVQYMSS